MQKIKTWLLRDTCSTELCNYRNVSGVRPVNDLSDAVGVGTSGLRLAVPSEASELLVMGTSVVPSNSGLLDTALPCTVGSKIKPGADGRCTHWAG